MRIEAIRDGDVDDRLDAAIRDLQVRAFPHEKLFKTSRHYRHHARPDDLRVLAWDDEALAAQVVAFWMTGRAGGRTWRLVGLGNVCSDPDRRGQGLAGRCLERTLELARQGGADFALLFCRPELERYYGRYGFQAVGNPLELTRTDGTTYLRDAHDIRMAAPLSGQAWPDGPVVLDVEDF